MELKCTISFYMCAVRMMQDWSVIQTSRHSRTSRLDCSVEPMAASPLGHISPHDEGRRLNETRDQSHLPAHGTTRRTSQRRLSTPAILGPQHGSQRVGRNISSPLLGNIPPVKEAHLNPVDPRTHIKRHAYGTPLALMGMPASIHPARPRITPDNSAAR